MGRKVEGCARGWRELAPALYMWAWYRKLGRTGVVKHKFEGRWLGRSTTSRAKFLLTRRLVTGKPLNEPSQTKCPEMDSI